MMILYLKILLDCVSRVKQKHRNFKVIITLQASFSIPDMEGPVYNKMFIKMVPFLPTLLYVLKCEKKNLQNGLFILKEKHVIMIYKKILYYKVKKNQYFLNVLVKVKV